MGEQERERERERERGQAGRKREGVGGISKLFGLVSGIEGMFDY